MRPVLFELATWVILTGTVLLGAIILFLNRKQPKKNLIIPAGMFAGAVILEAFVLKEAVKIPAYGFMIMIAFITGTYIAVWRAKRWGINPDHLIDGGLCAIIFGILGARALFIIQFFNEYFWGTGIRDGEEYNKAWNIFKIWQGGLVFYGGLAGAAVAIVVLLRMRKLKVSLLSDLILPSVILGLAITRIGCFLNGCCFGVVADVPWTVTFPPGKFAHVSQIEDVKSFIVSHKEDFDPEVFKIWMGVIENTEENGDIYDNPDPRKSRVYPILNEMKQKVCAKEGKDLAHCGYHTHTLLSTPLDKLWKTPLPVHPAQIYASVTAFLIFGLLVWLTRYRKFDGQIGSLFGMLYAVNRFILEMLRGDNGTFLKMTISQWISILLFIVSAAAYVYLNKKGGYTSLPVSADESSGQAT